MESPRLVIKETTSLLRRFIRAITDNSEPESATQSLEKAPSTKDQLELLYKMMEHVGNSANSSSLFA